MTNSRHDLHPTAPAIEPGRSAQISTAIAAYRDRRPAAAAPLLTGADRQRIAAGLSEPDLPLTTFAVRTGGIDPEDAVAIIGLASAMPAGARRVFEAAVLPASDWSSPTAANAG